jgi:hypothetical protein
LAAGSANSVEFGFLLVKVSAVTDGKDEESTTHNVDKFDTIGIQNGSQRVGRNTSGPTGETSGSTGV